MILGLLASISLHAAAQQPAESAQAPAPIVRRPTAAEPSPAPSGAPDQDNGSNPLPAPMVVRPPVVKKPKPAVPPDGTLSTTTGLPAPGRTPAPKAAKPDTDAPRPAAAAGLPGPFNRTLVLLDPGHGGGDSGSRISDQLLEKDVTLALTFRIRSLLSARGFSVLLTRDTDQASTAAGAPISLDDRAGTANHARPVACLLLHATGSGAGVHLYTSELEPAPAEPLVTAWLSAQAAWVAQSRRLADQLGQAFARAHIPLVQSRASVRPVDSLTCPALVVELAPSGTDVSTLTGSSYQQHVAEAIAGALVFWQNDAQPPPRMVAAPSPSFRLSEVTP